MKRPEGVSIISIYYYVAAGLLVMGACAMVTIPLIVAFAAQHDADARIAVPIVTVVMAVIMFFLVVLAVAYAGVGWGLWNLKPWARIGAIVLAVLSLASVPIGTIIGGLILWYMFQPEARAAFGETTGPAA